MKPQPTKLFMKKYLLRNYFFIKKKLRLRSGYDDKKLK